MLRVAVGAVFLGFGVLKYFPGSVPRRTLTKATTHLLTFGVIPDGVSFVAIATPPRHNTASPSIHQGPTPHGN